MCIFMYETEARKGTLVLSVPSNAYAQQLNSARDADVCLTLPLVPYTCIV